MKRKNRITTYLIIIEPPITWRGVNEYDMPLTGIVREIVTSKVRHKDSYIRNFNAVAFDARKFSIWAGLTSDTPTLGAVVHMRPIKKRSSAGKLIPENFSN